ncbi:hypothetical protein, partial [Pseudobutyrivibrio xylanivorans]
MKRSLVILLVAVLATTPISVLATGSPDDPAPIEETTTVSEPASAPEDTTPIVETPAPAEEDPVESPTVDGEPKEETPKSDVTSEEGNLSESEGEKGADVSAEGEVPEGELPEEKPEEESTDEDENSEHEHTFEYICNDDGTHTKRCTGSITIELEDGESEEVACDYEEIEPCEFGEDGKCIYCGYEEPEEEEEFNPSISFSNSNLSCTIGDSNPVICLYISQEDYDIAYAQVCYGNYSKNQFINVGLARGKYFDYRQNEFVTNLGDAWYGSPNILGEYSEGSYDLRSVYVRSTSGESVHYSLESDTLPEELQNNSIEVSGPKTVFGKVRDLLSSSNDMEVDKSAMEESPAPDADTPVVSDPSSYVEEEVVDNPEPVIAEPTPTPTPKATPTPTPKPTPTPTPKATPTPTP